MLDILYIGYNLNICALKGKTADFLNQPQKNKLIFSKKVRCHGIVSCKID
jgi:hypothetical protein